ncbi:MAG: hypothetical protein WCL49_04785, partial [bacterium]
MNAYASVGLLGYLFMAWCLWKIARDLKVGDEWMAWVPLINLFTLFEAHILVCFLSLCLWRTL